MNKSEMDATLKKLRPREMQAALQFLDRMETYSDLPAAEADEWRRRILGWWQFHLLGSERSAFQVRSLSWMSCERIAHRGRPISCCMHIPGA